jgi:hypothetical protein
VEEILKLAKMESPDIEASRLEDREPLLTLPSFTPPTAIMASSSVYGTTAVDPDAWPGGRKVCYAWRCLNLSYGAYLITVGGTLAVGTSPSPH